MQADLKRIILFVVCITLGLALGNFLRSLRPLGSGGTVSLAIASGTSFRDIARELEEKNVIRSNTAFALYAVATGAATRIQAGDYELSPAMSVPQIISVLTTGTDREVTVRIPEGASIYQVDQILADAGLLPKGAFLLYLQTVATSSEGRLFPDTYRFYKDSNPEDLRAKMAANFQAKTATLFGGLNDKEVERDLVVASILEKEVPDGEDRRRVAGILVKRIAAGMYLGVDATLCYMKQVKAGEYVPCQPITALDLKTNSKYNSYLYKGLPPGPIGSPGLDAIQSALHPIDTPYWYYLSDPGTKQTVFSRTLDEHTLNRVKYLKNTP